MEKEGIVYFNGDGLFLEFESFEVVLAVFSQSGNLVPIELDIHIMEFLKTSDKFLTDREIIDYIVAGTTTIEYTND